MSNEQHESNLHRVATNIAPLVLDFCRGLARSGIPSKFTMGTLVAYVQKYSSAAIAPDSPSRILRQLNARGDVEYRLVSRRRSLYELLDVAA